MAFLSRLFKWGAGDPPAEREDAHRQGMRDARQHPLGEFTDPEFQPSYVTEVRARARERITEVDRRLAATRTALLERAVGARETILRELGRADLRPVAEHANGHAPGAKGAGPADDPGAAASAGDEDAFISIAEARRRRAEARRKAVVQEAGDTVHRARAQIERLTQEWESALIERNHAVETVHARAEQLIAAYRGGVMRAHPRKEEIPSLWKGEVIAMDSSGDSAAAVSGREEIGRIMEEVEARIEVWHAEVVAPRALPGEARRSLPQDATPDADLVFDADLASDDDLEANVSLDSDSGSSPDADLGSAAGPDPRHHSDRMAGLDRDDPTAGGGR